MAQDREGELTTSVRAFEWFHVRQEQPTDPPLSTKTPMMLVVGWMDPYIIFPPYPAYDMSCVAEELVRARGKGAVASWPPASIGTSSSQHYLHTGFYDAVFRDGVFELGPATELGKLNRYHS